MKILVLPVATYTGVSLTGRGLGSITSTMGKYPLSSLTRYRDILAKAG